MNRVELKIYDGKTGQCKAVANRWQFQDVLMGEQFITLNISSETPIDFAIGDYCIFRGEEYILNYIPSLTQSAGIGERQDAFFYDSVKFNSHQDELSRCQMLDVTPTTGAYIASLGTNHTGSNRFSLYCGETTTEVVVDGVRKTVTLTAVCALAAKMQANLDRLYGEGKWLILVDTETTYKDGSGQDILVTHTDDKIIVFDNKTVLESLSEVHNTFDLDYSIKGRTIKIGYTLGNLTSDIDVEAFAFGYGKGYPTPLDSGKGLFQIKRISNSNQQVITRLRALGSTKNMPYRYYNKAYSNGNDDLSQTLFPTNLQLPGTFLEEGDPSDAPNPVGNTKWSRNNARSEYLRKVKGDTNDAYIDKDDDAESSVEGIREGSARWDGSDGNLQEIYPTIEESTYKELRDAGISDQDGETGSTAFPNYGDYERIDELLAIGYDDNGEVVDDANKGNGILSESDSIDLGILRTTSIDLTTLTYNKNDGGDFVEDSGRWVGKEVQLCVISDVMSGSYGFDPTIGAVSFGVRLSTENLWLNICYIVKIKQISKVNGITTLLAEYVSDMFTNGTIEDDRAKFLSYVETFLSEIPDSKNGLSAKVKEVKVTELSDIIITFTPAMVIKELPAGVNSFPFTYHVGKSNIHPVNFEPESSWISFDGNETPKDTFHVFIKDLGFELSATFTDDTPVLAMKSGQCVGREFSIGENIQRVSYNGKKGYMLTLTRAKDSSLNTYYPNSNCVIAAGDRYVLLNISMPDVYIKAAEVRLLRAATEYLADNCETKYTYQPYIDDIYLRRNYDNMLASGTPEKSIFWRLYSGLKFTFRGIPSSIDAPLPIADVTIERLTITMGEGLTPKVDLVLNDDVQQTTLQKLTTTVDRIYNGSLLSGGSGRTGSSTAALMSLLQTEGGKRFLSKLSPDTAQALITFLQGIAFGNGTYGIDGSGDAILHAIERLVSLTGQSYTGPDIIGDKGFRLWQDEEGYGHLDIDYLTARMKAYFAELEIRRVTFTQGDLFFSKAGSKIIRVVPVDRDGNELTPTVGTLHLFSSNGLFFSANGGWYALATTDEYTDGELLSQIYAYRCYELSDDGTTATVNLWEVGDMARCQTFNIDEGVHQGVTNRYYSRLVVRKGRKTMDDVDDGLQYNFVDLYVGNSTMPNRSVVDALYDDEGNTISKEHSGYVNNGVRYFVGYDPSIPSGFLQNDLPAVGDDIAQVGSQTYTERQNLIQLALSDGGAIKIYSGVNTYNLADFEKVRIGPNGVVVDAAYFRLRSGADTQSEGMGVAVWRGKWSSMASYAKMDYVEHLGSLWIWMEDTIAQGIYCEPGDNGGWELYVSRGEAGEAPKLCSIVLDSSNVAVVAESDGTVTMENISGLPTTMYVDYGGERVPTSAMSKVVVAGFRIKGDGPQQVGQGICPRNYSINEDDISLSWYLASQRISAKMLFSVTFEADGEEHDVSMYLPVLKTTKAKDGANGANAVDVVLSPAALTIEETSFDGTTRSYDLTNAKAQVRIIDGDTEVIPESISRSVSPSGALSTQYDANEGMIAVTDVNSDTAKSAVVGVTVSYGGNSYTRYLHVYINRMGTWELQAERDVVRSISQKEMTFVDKDGHPITTTQMTEIFQDAARIALTGSLIEFKDVDGQIFMRMAREDGKAVVAGEYFRIENLTARDLNITGQSVFRGFLMREKYTIKREDFVQASGVWYLPDLVHFGSWVEFAEDINYPVSYYELRLPHFPLQQDESVVYIDDQVVEVSNMTDAQWDDYCAYVMQFVGAKMLVENNTISPNAITLDLFTLFQHYGDTSHSQEPFRIWEPLLGLTTLECKCAYINNAYYTGMAVYWEMSTGGIPSKDNRINI